MLKKYIKFFPVESKDILLKTGAQRVQKWTGSKPDVQSIFKKQVWFGWASFGCSYVNRLKSCGVAIERENVGNQRTKNHVSQKAGSAQRAGGTQQNTSQGGERTAA